MRTRQGKKGSTTQSNGFERDRGCEREEADDNERGIIGNSLLAVAVEL